MVELKEENVLDLNALDIELIATALADQSDGEHQWLIDPTTGELVMWTSDTGIDGHNPVELDDLDPNLIAIDPIPSYVWYQDMVDFADRINDRAMGNDCAGPWRGEGHSADSRTSSTSTPSSSRRGRPCATPAPDAAPSAGSSTKNSSRPKRRRSTSTATPTQNSPERTSHSSSSRRGADSRSSSGRVPRAGQVATSHADERKMRSPGRLAVFRRRSHTGSHAQPAGPRGAGSHHWCRTEPARNFPELVLLPIPSDCMSQARCSEVTFVTGKWRSSDLLETKRR